LDRDLTYRINQNTDRMSELIASSFDGSRSGSRLEASRMSSPQGSSPGGRPHSSMDTRRKSSMWKTTFTHDLSRDPIRSGQINAEKNLRPKSAMSGWSSNLDEAQVDRLIKAACPKFGEEERELETFIPRKPLSAYQMSYSIKATVGTMPRYSSIHEKPLTKEQRDKQVIDAKVQKEKQMIDSFKLPPRKFARPSGASRSMSEMSDVVLPYDIPQHRIDFLLRQLRLLCYRKVKGNGSDVSVREVFRHFDANKDEDDEGNAGIDGENPFPPRTFIPCSFLDDTLTESASHVFRCAVNEFTDALKKMMMGTAVDGLITDEEAACMFRMIDADNGGTINYREVALLLTQPGWDSRIVGRLSNIML
jgi:hypothetical protein